MPPTVIIRETAAVGSTLSAIDVRDLAHVRRLLLQAAVSVESEGVYEHVVPVEKLHLLRGFLSTVGAADAGSARRLLLMALLQLEDEDEAKRLVVPSAILPALVAGK